MTAVDLEGFRVWATGNLVENRNRGIFAEWLVGTALGVVGVFAVLERQRSLRSLFGFSVST